MAKEKKADYYNEIIPVLPDLVPDTAYNFRTRINENFKAIINSFRKSCDKMTNLVVSREEPPKESQKTGDLWFKEM